MGGDVASVFCHLTSDGGRGHADRFVLRLLALIFLAPPVRALISDPCGPVRASAQLRG